MLKAGVLEVQTRICILCFYQSTRFLIEYWVLMNVFQFVAIVKSMMHIGISKLNTATFTLTAAAFLRSSTTSAAFHNSLKYNKNAAFTRFLKTKRAMSSPGSTNQIANRVAVLQFPVSADKDVNLQTASSYIDQAAGLGARLVVLPEIWNGPYAATAFPEYAEELPNLGEQLDEAVVSKSLSLQMLRSKAMEHSMLVIGGSISEKEDEKIYNTCLCISPQGELVGKHRKVHLFDIDVPGKITFFESDTLTGGSTVTTFDGGEPFGKIGVGICYDIRFPELSQCMIERGCRMLVFPGAFNMTTGPAHWELLQRSRAVDGQCFVLSASPARTEPTENSKYPHYTAWGHSTITAPWGDVLASCDEKPNIITYDLDMSLVEEMRQSIPTSQQKRKDLYTFTDITK